MITVQYLCQTGPTAGRWVDVPSAPEFTDPATAADWCEQIYAQMDPITWAYAPDLRVVSDTVTAVFHAVRQTPRVYA